MIAPQFTVNQAPVAPFTGVPLIRTAAALNAHHTSAFRILSPDDTHFFDINVSNQGDSVIEATEGVDVKGLHLPDLPLKAALATDATGKIIAGTPMGGGPGGNISISDLANAYRDHTIESYDNYNEISGNFTSGGGGYQWLLWDSSDSSTSTGHQLYIWNKGDDLVIPFDVGIGMNGWKMEPRTGNFEARGTSKLVSPISSGIHRLTIDFYVLSGGMVESPGPNRRWSMSDTIFGNDYKHDALIGADPHHFLTEVPDNTRGNRVAFASTFLGGHGDHMKTGDVVLQSGDNEGHNEEEQTGSVNISPGLVRSPEVSHPMNGSLTASVAGYIHSTQTMGTLACVADTAFSPQTGPAYGRCSISEIQSGKWVGIFKEYTILPGTGGYGHSVSVAVVGQTFFASSTAQSWHAGEAICSSTTAGYLIESDTCTAPSVMVGIVTWNDTLATNTHWGVILSHR
jgi:hypothetical protein